MVDSLLGIIDKEGSETEFEPWKPRLIPVTCVSAISPTFLKKYMLGVLTVLWEGANNSGNQPGYTKRMQRGGGGGRGGSQK